MELFSEVRGQRSEVAIPDSRFPIPDSRFPIPDSPKSRFTIHATTARMNPS